MPSEVGDAVAEEAGGLDMDNEAMEGDAEDADVGGNDLDDEEMERPKKRAPRNAKKSKKPQPKAADYDEETEALLNHGLGYMRSMVISENPMPSVDESINLAGDAYRLAKADRPHVATPSDIKYISIVSPE